MADPVITDVYRAQVRWQGPSGLPNDVFVNTFAFRNQALASEMAPRIVTALTAFYGFFGGFLSPAIMDVANPEVRVYDLGQEPPRTPTILPMSLAAGSGTTLPAEVAICLSYYSFTNQPRSRGRIYVGPLLASSGAMSEGDLRPTQKVQDDLLAGAANLIESSLDLDWGFISQRDGDFKEITHAWVDNAYDTQRRRGLEPTGRTRYPAVV